MKIEIPEIKFENKENPSPVFEIVRIED